MFASIVGGEKKEVDLVARDTPTVAFGTKSRSGCNGVFCKNIHYITPRIKVASQIFDLRVQGERYVKDVILAKYDGNFYTDICAGR